MPRPRNYGSRIGTPRSLVSETFDSNKFNKSPFMVRKQTAKYAVLKEDQIVCPECYTITLIVRNSPDLDARADPKTREATRCDRYKRHAHCPKGGEPVEVPKDGPRSEEALP